MANARKKSKSNDEIIKTEADIVSKIDPKLFNSVNTPDRQQALVRQILSITKMQSGPLPDPETLQQYKEIYPESVQIIFDVFKNQSSHRTAMETLVVTSQQKQSAWGQIYAFIIAIFVFAGSMFLIYLGHEVSGGILGSVDLVGLVTVFIMGRFYQVNNLKSKSPQKALPLSK
ncbi:DUF2335 domain-containing protein [Mucilaginibacter sp.]|uniref:DUF2335 domain-containing protein n=1 Tax=Mucilaginibacter sp. TaxID=1882438 RepID=UPI003AFFFCD6